MIKMEFSDKMQRCRDYVEALEEERKKILVFQRELPLCLELVTQAIEASKREMSGTTMDYMQGQSEWSEQTSSEGPVLEEFIPIKRTHSCSDNEDENEDEDGNLEEPKSHSVTNRSSKDDSNNKNNNNSDSKKKSDWLRSVQLWSQSPDPSPKEDVARKEAVRSNGGAFQPFRKEKSGGNGKSSGGNNNNNQTIGKTTASNVPAAAASSSGGSSGGNKEEKEEQQRKKRRCWSPELHRRFLQALQQLGGSHAATPKQIRELLKVDGLTNDEVKSHLQKYRLHTRRPSSAMHNNNNAQTPQFVFVGGIWMPPPEYAAVASAETGAANTIYAPVAAPPSITQLSTSVLQNQQSSQSGSEGRGSHSEGGVHSNSPSTSSSTHTTTNSPNF